mgnify:CR=1 FL=1
MRAECPLAPLNFPDAVNSNVFAPLAGTLPQPQFVFSTARFYGGAGDPFGTGVAVAGGYAYVSGSTTANGDDALVMRCALPLGTAPEWAAMWPQLSGGDRFLGLGVSSEGVSLAGYSWGRTMDTVGGTEDKGFKYFLN